MKNTVKDVSTIISNHATQTGDAIADGYKTISDKLSGTSLPFLSNPELLKWSESITEGTATAFDKALDMDYLKTHIGGGNHRMFDGGHDLFNAWDRVKAVKSDDSTTEEIVSYVSAIWKDLTTKQGLPFFTWEKENYDKYAEWFSEHIPFMEKSYFYDLMSFDVFEVFGASIGVASLVFGLKKDDQKKVAEVLGSMGVTSIASANPIMAIALVFITAYVIVIKKKGIDKGALAKGAIISTISISIFSILGFPLLVELGVAIIVTTLIRKKVIENEELMSMVKGRLLDIKSISQEQFSWSVKKIESLLAEINNSKVMSQLNEVKNESWYFVTKTIPSIPIQSYNYIAETVKK